MIPREGGNRFSGDFKMAAGRATGSPSNLTERHQGPRPHAGNAIDRIIDYTFALGGPIMKDKLWFFTSARYFSVNNFIANTFFDDGSQGIDDQFIKSAMARVTWQASPRNKLSAYFDEIDKYRGHDMQSNDDPETASLRWFSPAYNTGSRKWTSTVSTSMLLLEAGLFAQPRVLHQQLPGGRREAAGSRRNGSPTRRATRTTSAAARPPRPARPRRARSATTPGVGVVRDRRAQLQGRLPVHVGRLLAHRRRQRRSHAAVPQQRTGVRRRCPTAS